MAERSELTICSVYYSSLNKDLLELNWELVNKLNSSKNWVWLVADNTPTEVAGKIDGKKFQVIPGAKYEDLPDYIRPWMKGSYHHTLAINNSLEYIKNRFALFLDSDFYIVRPEWVTEIIDHMKENNLAFFGVPWHPKHIKKYRYFPTIHSLFVDFGKVSKNDLIFSPQYEEILMPSFKTRLVRKAKKIFLKFLSAERRSIGESHDSGYAIFRKYKGNRKFKFECPKPVFMPERDLKAYPAALSSANRILEKFLPDRFCFFPKKKNYYTEIGFSRFGYFDAVSQGWEEFIWKEKPFGFHLRGSYRLKSDSESSVALVHQVLNSL